MNFQSGPVALRDDVLEAFEREPIPHRSGGFIDMLDAIRGALQEMTGASEVALIPGSGTLANDAVAAHLSGRGLILTNGEFGERLANQARRWRLDARVAWHGWGSSIDFDYASSLGADVDWVWAVHCETSTGVVNDLDELKAFASGLDADLVLDCISSLGAIDVDLSDVHLATGVSGKALAAPAGVGIVLGERVSSDLAPASIDLARYWRGCPFTMQPQVVAALRKSLERDWTLRHSTVLRLGTVLRGVLEAAGYRVIGNAPHVLTVEMPADEVARLESLGFRFGAHSGYLRKRSWAQFCLMGEVTEADVLMLGEAIRR